MRPLLANLANWIFGSHFFDVAFGIAIGAVLAMALSSERHDIRIATSLLLITVGLAAARAGHWLTTETILPLPRMVLAPILFAFIGIAWYATHVWISNKLADHPWFQISVRSAIVSDSGPLTSIMAHYQSTDGDTLSPILYLAYVELANNDDQPRSIDGLKFEVGKDAEGPWEEVMSIPLNQVDLVLLLEQGKTASSSLTMCSGTFRMGTAPPKGATANSFHVALVPALLEDSLSTPIQPHSSLYGWIALDSLRHSSAAPGDIYLRVKVSEGASPNELFSVSEFPSSNSKMVMNVNCGVIVTYARTFDLSKSAVRYYSDQTFKK